MPVLLRCHKGVGPAVTGTALVAADNFSARYDLDRTRGVFSRPTHKLAGESYVDRILVLDGAKGGVATAWMLHEIPPARARRRSRPRSRLRTCNPNSRMSACHARAAHTSAPHRP